MASKLPFVALLLLLAMAVACNDPRPPSGGTGGGAALGGGAGGGSAGGGGTATGGGSGGSMGMGGGSVGGGTQGPVALVQDGEAHAYGFASMKRQDGQLFVGSYVAVTGTLEGQPLDAVIQDGVVQFAVPSLAVGAHPLTLTLPGGGSAQGMLAVTAVAAIDTEAVLTQFTTDMQDSLNEAEQNLNTLAASTAKDSALAHVQQARQRLSSWQTTLGSATPDQRAAFGHALAEAQASLATTASNLDTLLAQVYSMAPVDPDLMQQRLAAFEVVLLKYAGKVLVVVAAGIAFGWSGVTVVAGLVLVAKMAAEVATAWAALADAAFEPLSMTAQPTAGGTTLQTNSDEPVNFSMGARFGRLQASDEASQVSWIASALGALAKVRAALARLGTSDFAPYSAQQTEVGLPAFAQQAVTVEVLNNSAVTASVGGSEAAPTVTFRTSALTNQQAQYRVTYGRAGFSMASAAALVLLNVNEQCMTTAVPNGPDLLITRRCYIQSSGDPTRFEYCAEAYGASDGGFVPYVGRLDLTIYDGQGGFRYAGVSYDKSSNGGMFEKANAIGSFGLTFATRRGAAWSSVPPSSRYETFSYASDPESGPCSGTIFYNISPGAYSASFYDGGLVAFAGGSGASVGREDYACSGSQGTTTYADPGSQAAVAFQINSLRASDSALLTSGACGTDYRGIANILATGTFGP